MRHFTSLAALSLACAAAPAVAQSGSTATPPDAGSAAAEPGGDSITIGAGGVYLPDYEGSDHYHLRAAPGAIGSVDGHAFTLAGNRFSLDLIPNKPGPTWDLQFGPIGVLNFDRSSVKSIGDPRIKALGKVGTAIELGGYAGIGKTGVITSDYDSLSLSVSYRHDVNGKHHSGIWQPSINYQTPLSRSILVGVFASAEHVGQRYADTYFGITPAQSVASGLVTTHARGGWKNYTLGALGTVALTGDLLHGFKLVGGGTYERLLNDFAASPVVSVAGRKHQWLGVLGVAYTF